MKRPTRPRRLLCVTMAAAAIAAAGASPSRAGIWDDLRERVGSLLGSRSTKRDQALQARQKAQALDARAQAARSRLGGAQRALLDASQSYSQIQGQVKSTEADIVRERHRRFLITERYNRRRILFGRRLAAMQRSGSMDYLQIFLGSRTLSDLTRRAYLFRALMTRDADLQSQLRTDKAEIDGLNNALASRLKQRKVLSQDALRERGRIARATQQQRAELGRLVSSRDALQAFAAQRVGEMKDLNQAVLDYNARAQDQAIAQARQEEAERRESARRAREAEESRDETRSLRRRYRYASDTRDDSDEANNGATPTRSRYRSSYSGYSGSGSSSRRRYSRRYDNESPSARRASTYRRPRRSRGSSRGSSEASDPAPRMVRVRVAERVDRVRRVPTLGGGLRPMSIPEIVFKEKSVPISSGGGSNSNSNPNSGAPSSGPSSRPSSGGKVDDFPASDP